MQDFSSLHKIIIMQVLLKLGLFFAKNSMVCESEGLGMRLGKGNVYACGVNQHENYGDDASDIVAGLKLTISHTDIQMLASSVFILFFFFF